MSSSASTVELKTEDVVKLIMQFLKEQGLTRSLKTLQEETQVSLNIVDSVDTFAENIREGKWDRVLDEVQKLRLPGNKLMDLYEIVVGELLEMGESLAAQIIVKSALKPTGLFEEFKERALRLEYLSKKTPIDIRELYQDKLTKEKRRSNLATALIKEVVTAPSSRLLTLLGDSLRYQESTGVITTGIKLDLFTGHIPTEEDKEDIPTNKVEKVVQFGESSRLICVEFSSNGNYLGLGSADGIIEIWDSVLMRLKSDLTYQLDEQFMFHEEAVDAMSFSTDCEILVSADRKGLIKVWKVSSGKCLKKIETAMSGGISSMRFGYDSSHLLVGSATANFIRIYGLRSSSILMEFRVHANTHSTNNYSVNDITTLASSTNKDHPDILTASSDGYLRIWNSQSGEQKVQYQLPRTEHQTSNEVPIYSIAYTYKNKGIIVCDRSSRIAVLDPESFDIEKEFLHGNSQNEDFAAASLSPQKSLLYGLTAKGYMYCYRENDAKVQAFFKLAEDEILGLKHHPSKNIQVAWTSNGNLLFLKPS